MKVVEFRWNKPQHENGVLTRFEIFYQIFNQNDTNRTVEDWLAVNVTPSVMSFQLGGRESRLQCCLPGTRVKMGIMWVLV